jgi:hypothetical protein
MKYENYFFKVQSINNHSLELIKQFLHFLGELSVVHNYF